MQSQVQGLKACRFQARVKLTPPCRVRGLNLDGGHAERRQLLRGHQRHGEDDVVGGVLVVLLIRRHDVGVRVDT